MQYEENYIWKGQNRRECSDFILIRRLNSSYNDNFEIENFNNNNYNEEEIDMDRSESINIEDNIINELHDFHLGYQMGSNEFFFKRISKLGIFIKLEQDAEINDLIELLKKWCLDGPYPINEYVFECGKRKKKVSISNTITTNHFIWKQLSLLMKGCLKDSYNEKEIRMVQMSPMYRYYGDLYPDNGRDSDFNGLDDVFDYC